MTWTTQVNGFLYEFIGLVLQAAQAHNVTAPGGRKYNVPSGKITIDDTVATFYPNRTSYSQVAISGADNFNDSDTTIREIFDIIVENTRQVTPACRLSLINCSLIVVHFTDPSLTQLEPFGR